MKVLLDVLLASVLAISASAQTPSSPQLQTVKHPPRFEDFPVTENWNQPPAPLKLTIHSERMFRTQLTNAAKEPPNFAGHCRITFWGCGSQCGAGAVVDLQTGSVFPPPLGAHGNGWERWIISPAFLQPLLLTSGSIVDWRWLRVESTTQKHSRRMFLMSTISFGKTTASGNSFFFRGSQARSSLGPSLERPLNLIRTRKWTA